MIRSTYQIWEYRFDLDELRVMVDAAKREDRSILKGIREAITTGMGIEDGEARIRIESGDECSITVNGINVDVDVDDVCNLAAGFLVNWPSDDGDLWS